MPKQKRAPLVRQRFRRRERSLQEWIGRAPGGVILHLFEHGGHEVERLANPRKLLKQMRHAVVILERVHARPR